MGRLTTTKTSLETLVDLKQDYPHLYFEDKVLFPGTPDASVDNRMEGIAEEVSAPKKIIEKQIKERRGRY